MAGVREPRQHVGRTTPEPPHHAQPIRTVRAEEQVQYLDVRVLDVRPERHHHLDEPVAVGWSQRSAVLEQSLTDELRRATRSEPGLDQCDVRTDAFVSRDQLGDLLWSLEQALARRTGLARSRRVELRSPCQLLLLANRIGIAEDLADRATAHVREQLLFERDSTQIISGVGRVSDMDELIAALDDVVRLDPVLADAQKLAQRPSEDV